MAAVRMLLALLAVAAVLHQAAAARFVVTDPLGILNVTINSGAVLDSKALPKSFDADGNSKVVSAVYDNYIFTANSGASDATPKLAISKISAAGKITVLKVADLPGLNGSLANCFLGGYYTLAATNTGASSYDIYITVDCPTPNSCHAHQVVVRYTYQPRYNLLTGPSKIDRTPLPPNKNYPCGLQPGTIFAKLRTIDGVLYGVLVEYATSTVTKPLSLYQIGDGELNHITTGSFPCQSYLVAEVRSPTSFFEACEIEQYKYTQYNVVTKTKAFQIGKVLPTNPEAITVDSEKLYVLQTRPAAQGVKFTVSSHARTGDFDTPFKYLFTTGLASDITVV